MHVRRFRPNDASALAAIFRAAVQEIARGHYSADQIEAWSVAVPSPQRFVALASDGRLLLVAVDDHDQPAAFGDLEEDGHIDQLYCRPDVAGTGLVGRLYDELEATAIERGMTRLFVEASEPARRFFARRNFALVSRREFSLGGVPIHNFAMEKWL